MLEFGAGISTVILGSILRTLDSEVSLMSVNENQQWIDHLKNVLMKEDITYVKSLHQPLISNHENEDYRFWYDLEDLGFKVKHKSEIVVVDGPCAWQKERQHARKPALNFLLNHDLLNTDSLVVYLDDCHRKGEKQILNEWANQLNLSPKFPLSTLGRIAQNDLINVD